jgi:ribosomal-protein-alanine N-acetyltransferase
VTLADRVHRFPAFPELETRRLSLREITADDLSWYHAHFSRPEIVRGQGFAAPADPEAAARELRLYVLDLFALRAGFRWGIALRGSRELIGSVGYYRWLDEPRPQAEIGYDLAPEWWGRGLMSEALEAVLAFGFQRMELARVEAYVMADNERSSRLLERLGFDREELLAGHGEDEHGQPCDELRYALARPASVEDGAGTA